MKTDTFDILDRINLHLNAVNWLEDHAPNDLGCVIGSLRESIENTAKMVEANLYDQGEPVTTLKERTLREKIINSPAA